MVKGGAAEEIGPSAVKTVGDLRQQGKEPAVCTDRVAKACLGTAPLAQPQKSKLGKDTNTTKVTGNSLILAPPHRGLQLTPCQSH